MFLGSMIFKIGLYKIVDVNFYPQQARQYIQEPYPDGYQPWTGPGYMLVREGDSLEFHVNDIDFPTNYDIIIRYDLRVRNSA